MFRLLILYTALAAGANTGFAGEIDLSAAREGGIDLVAGNGEPVTDTGFTNPDGAELSLSDYKGQALLLNFWATWCAPCREEMPALNSLQKEFGGENFQVVTIATGRNPLPAIEKFYTEENLDALPVLLDPRQKLAREFGVVAMPATILIDRDGNEAARLMGPAEWNSETARVIVTELTAP
ncbi:TlpA disulfide reductase family protein [Paracoccus aerodenitrificans]|uniref:TlpA disulfide reductase family protein n=1 Tax=Paracoccus aerodenitrificans TaxID=3017781 RepID=UPI0022F09118|nr:TlpA disulfide reductase family protein [Paracoccus aerodenitrificans]WBU64357.1 TlpA disulfide reductase family protein [Paracoccus aerodenitrificans]